MHDPYDGLTPEQHAAIIETYQQVLDEERKIVEKLRRLMEEKDAR